MTAPDGFWLSVDPGKTTGLATAHPGSDEPSAWEMPLEGALDWAWDWMSAYCGRGDVTVVCESYVIGPATLRKGGAGGTWSLRGLGALEWMARRNGHRFVEQRPAEAKAFGTDAKLRALGWWSPSDHARDALRHLLLARVADGEEGLAAAVLG